MSGERLIYLPLGGAGEIGMNAYVFGWGPPGQERLLVVDLGVTFGDMASTPGIDLILPDIAWLEERRDRIEGIVITHAHEDHVGALGLLWGRLRAPVHARPFTAAIARHKLDERGEIPAEALRIADPWPAQVEIGPFRVGFVPISHSIPESSGLVIDTPAGRIVHSADFKIDPDPVVGEPFDEDLWRSVGQGGVLALTCDSTNVFNAHEGRSESSLQGPIRDFVRACPGLVVATTFASNVGRLLTLARAAEEAGRSVCLLGRAMRRMVETATETGVLRGFPRSVSPEEAAEIPRENLFILATGSQGERRAATAQLAQNGFLGLSVQEGDTVLFSSSTIPGNERDVARLMNLFSERGVRVAGGEPNGRYHVSGHANRPDLERFHALLDPALVIPMHGEHRHLTEHARLAGEWGRRGVVVPNGALLEIGRDGTARIAEHVETGRTYLDGSGLIGALDGVVRDRLRMGMNGHLTVTLILDEDDRPLGEPWCEPLGLPARGRSGDLRETVEAEMEAFMNRAEARLLRDDERLEKELIRLARQVVQAEIGKKPEVTVVVSRLA
ncbi:ribonuclease J [Rubellimicrobium sp. CFH 75288]|uniref:ribonuclease J n=1 Tax=Rubellimicrobium sp. CFH 75288 TaxID=2697034 RepID=UPI00141237A8|nr:ribonuclease J [Rubellimicrobium sp. CFH 75288]NAZ35794.1 MBL fold metallo-hydrolase [Rubellimicrobium sp. CFH 75288]